MRQRFRSFRGRSMARRRGEDGRLQLTPEQLRWIGWIAAVVLIAGIALVVRVLGGNGDGTAVDPESTPSASAGPAAIAFGTALDPATGMVAADAATSTVRGRPDVRLLARPCGQPAGGRSTSRWCGPPADPRRSCSQRPLMASRPLPAGPRRSRSTWGSTPCSVCSAPGRTRCASTSTRRNRRSGPARSRSALVSPRRGPRHRRRSSTDAERDRRRAPSPIPSGKSACPSDSSVAAYGRITAPVNT